MEKIKRLEILINRLDLKTYPSKQDLIDYLYSQYEEDISTRTLERDFLSLETNFHIKIAYNRSKNGYYLLEEDREQIASFLNFSGRVYLADLFKKRFKDFETLTEIVKIEDHSSFDGLEWIEKIYLAINQKRKLSFVHHNYMRDSLKKYCIAPFELREYQGRWYVVGVAEEEGNYKSYPQNFGLDRIKQLKLDTSHSIKKESYTTYFKRYRDIIGLNYDEMEEVVHIQLAVQAEQYKYLESLPLHHSQVKEKVLADGRVQIGLRLIPNFELKMQLLKLGERVEIISPKFLRDEIKTTLEKALNQYNKH